MFVIHLFSERIAAIWNNLECDIVDFTNTKCIKMDALIVLWFKQIHSLLNFKVKTTFPLNIYCFIGYILLNIVSPCMSVASTGLWCHFK